MKPCGWSSFSGLQKVCKCLYLLSVVDVAPSQTFKSVKERHHNTLVKVELTNNHISYLTQNECHDSWCYTLTAKNWLVHLCRTSCTIPPLPFPTTLTASKSAKLNWSSTESAKLNWSSNGFMGGGCIKKHNSYIEKVRNDLYSTGHVLCKGMVTTRILVEIWQKKEIVTQNF